MNSRCVLCGTKPVNEDIAHFRFPKEKSKFNDWKSFCLQINSSVQIFPTSKLCCIHFSQDSFSSLFKRHILHKNAIPTINNQDQDASKRKCNHNILPSKPKLVTEKRSYGWHLGSRYCLLCRSKRSGIAAFSFPKDDEIRQQWMEFCDVDDTRIKIGSTLCQYHFTDNDFRISNCGRVYLKSGAIPSIRSVNIEFYRSEDISNTDYNENIDNVQSSTNLGDVPRNEHNDDSNLYKEVGDGDRIDDLRDVDSNKDVDGVDYFIPPKKPRSDIYPRFDDPINSNTLSCQVYEISTEETGKVGECSFCKITTADLVQFRFPNNPPMHLFIKTKCGLSSPYFDTTHEICISHFHSDDIGVDNDGKRTVKDGALPWKYLSEMIPNSSDNISHSSIINSSTERTAISSTPKSNRIEMVTPVAVKRKRKAYLGDITPSDFKTPRCARRSLIFIKDKFKDASVKIKKLQDQNRKANQRVKNVLETLKNLKTKELISDDVAITVHQLTENYGTLPISLRQLIARLLHNGENKYLPELRMFALTLNFYSPVAYNYLRKTWLKILPHPRTIRRWYSSVNGQPGFTEEVLRALKARAAHKKRLLICNLAIDEVAIRKQLIREKSQAFGQVDLGLIMPPPPPAKKKKNNQTSDDYGLAKNALVFMLVALNDDFRVPVGYFLICSLTGRYRANLLQLCLQKVHDAGIVISSITFDGHSVNFTMCKTLGANFDVNSPEFEPSILHPVTRERVFIFLDPSHWIKLLRNALAELRFLKDAEGRIISWKDIENLFKLEQFCGLRLGTKLTKQHIYFSRSKMKVKLASQVFSKSVATALQYLRQKKVEKFINSEGTEKFCTVINNAFDIMNCRNFSCYTKQPFSKPVTPELRSEIITRLDEIVEYIKGLKTIDDKPVLHKSFERHTGFVGLIMCCRNLIRLFDTYNSKGLKFLFSFKLSQDHLETFFSDIRRRCFQNNNPNAVQFAAAYRQLLVHHEIKASEKGNCLIEDIPILYVTSLPSQVMPDYDERQEFLMIDDPEQLVLEEEEVDNPDQIVDDEDYQEPTFNPVCTMAEAQIVRADVSEYIAGFAIASLQHQGKIDAECREILTSSTTTNIFLQFKNRGGLCYPSEAVKSACYTLDLEFRRTATDITQPHFYNTLINNVFTKVEELFQCSHFENNLDHKRNIISCVFEKYLKAKARHFCRSLTDAPTNRQQNNKNVLFSHK